MSGGFSFFLLFPGCGLVKLNADTICGCMPKDQQLGQLYELMQTIKNKNEGDGENQ